MPELVNISVGSLPGTSGLEATMVWPLATKKSRKLLRMSATEIEGMVLVLADANRRFYRGSTQTGPKGRTGRSLPPGIRSGLVSPHRSSVGLRWPTERFAALHRLPIQLGIGCAMRPALRPDGCAQPTASARCRDTRR